jgi:hypothetical protein
MELRMYEKCFDRGSMCMSLGCCQAAFDQGSVCMSLDSCRAAFVSVFALYIKTHGVENVREVF